jgi:hypothetical protein
MKPDEKNFYGSTFLVVIVFLFLVIVVGLVGNWEPAHRWLIIVGLMIAFLVVMGVQVNGRPSGFLIDSRFKMSLSRLQIVLWTILVLSAYLTIALDRNIPGLVNPENALAEPLMITFPPELLLALGISAASFAGSSLVKTTKMGKELNIELKNEKKLEVRNNKENADTGLKEAKSNLEEKARKLTDLEGKRDGVKTRLDEATTEDERETAAGDLKRMKGLVENAIKDRDQANDEVKTAESNLVRAKQEWEDFEKTEREREGLLHRNSDPSDAAWVDIFRGEEIGNYKLIDMANVQMFFFTIAVVFTYGVAVYGLLGDATKLQSAMGVAFPDFSSSLNALLGISHSGYLTVKTADHTKVEG